MISSELHLVPPSNLVVRTFRPEDQAAVSRLYVEGLLVGQLSPNDTGADIDNITDGYLSDRRSHFWVAEIEGNVLGMIGVMRDGDQQHTAEIRRLRVDPAWQQSPIGAKLIETALSHCQQHGFLKVVFDTRFERSAALPLFERFGFQHTRTKELAGKELLEFYLDLYHRPRKDSEATGV